MTGAPATAIQELAGHRDLVTTQRYTHLSPAAIEAAIRLLDRPLAGAGDGDIAETEAEAAQTKRPKMATAPRFTVRPLLVAGAGLAPQRGCHAGDPALVVPIPPRTWQRPHGLP